MKNSIDWQALAQQLGTLRSSGESGGDDPARRALDVIIGPEQLRAAVDHYLAYRPGRELVRSVLHILHSWTATQYCYDVYRSNANLDMRRAAVELLRFIADNRALVWVEEFLTDEDAEIQGWGLALVDQLLFSERAFPEECSPFLDKAEQHANPHIRVRAAEIKRSFPSLAGQKNGVPSVGKPEDRRKNTTDSSAVQADGDSPVPHETAQLALTQGIVPESMTNGQAGRAPEAPENLPTPQEYSAFIEAIERGDTEAVTRFLQNEVPVNAQDSRGYTPLGRAAEVGNSGIVQLLLAHHALPDMADHRGYTPLLAAADKGHSEVVRRLLEAKATVNAKSVNGARR
ncbi:MAG: ankyrin repeat domain-containing protein [Deltaproteobacteria bacterium]|nr:ankyrin repeat domain-containing protein [Deltaproteobacteria bacterium]